MNFAPHHQFSACQKLEQTFERIRQAGNAPANVCSDYAKYHFSLLHKFKSARYHVDTLEAYLGTQTAQQIDPHALVYRVNFHFDGFLQTLGSALDILARETLGYFSIVPAGNVYYRTARLEIATTRPTDAALPLLADPAWKAEFSEYRNTAIHENLIGTQFQVEMRVEGHRAIRKLVFPVPDDPRQNPATYRNNPDIVAYCKTTFKRALSHTNQLYSHLETRARASNVFPL